MDEAFNASLIVGIATLTMVLSITTSSTARHRAVRASPLFPDRACLRTGMGVGINERSDCISMLSYCVTMLSTNETILLSVGDRHHPSTRHGSAPRADGPTVGAMNHAAARGAGTGRPCGVARGPQTPWHVPGPGMPRPMGPPKSAPSASGRRVRAVALMTRPPSRRDFRHHPITGPTLTAGP